MDDSSFPRGSILHPLAMATYAQGGAPYQRYREMSIEDMLLENRIIFLAGPIHERTASLVIMRLLYLQSVKRDQDIHLYINCPGGLVDQTLAIYDTMRFLSCDIATYSIGQAASGGAVILTAGTKGKRYALPNSKIMLHQPWGGVTGQAEDIRIQAEEILRDKRRSRSLSQVELARMLNSSQSRVAKMEGGDPSVSLDLLIRSLYTLGASNRDLARAITAPALRRAS